MPVNETASSFALNVTGYSTTRTLTSVTLQFTAAAAMTLGTSQVTIDIRQVATAWFQSTASQSFGGQFTVTLPFTLQGTPPTGKTLLQTIASIAATISNESGASNSLVATLPFGVGKRRARAAAVIVIGRRKYGLCFWGHSTLGAWTAR